jgi:hypothetical protein
LWAGAILGWEGGVGTKKGFELWFRLFFDDCYEEDGL